MRRAYVCIQVYRCNDICSMYIWMYLCMYVVHICIYKYGMQIFACMHICAFAQTQVHVVYKQHVVCASKNISHVSVHVYVCT